VLPVGTFIDADQHAPEGAFLTMVVFTSFAFLRQCRARLKLGDTPGLDGCRFSDLIEEGPTVKAAARCLVRSRLFATEPQWPRMNSTFSRSLRTRHSRVIPKISLRALRLLGFRPSSLPRFAASGAALREPLCERDSVLRFLPREGPLAAKRALTRTRTAALSVTEFSTWPTRSRLRFHESTAAGCQSRTGRFPAIRSESDVPRTRPPAACNH
jgi:hypothetical protein